MMKDKIKGTIEKVETHCHDTKSFHLKLDEPFTFHAGQFIMVNVPYKDTFLRRAYSIASSPKSGKIELCLNYVPDGKASDYLFNLSSGETLHFDGPYGIFKIRKSSNDKFFVCTGTGVTPLRSMIHHLLEEGATEQIYLIFGERTREELLYQKEFEELSKKYSNFHYVPTLSRGDDSWKGEKGYVQDVMKKYINDPSRIHVYVCGLKAMVDDVCSTLLDLGVEKSSFFSEKFV